MGLEEVCRARFAGEEGSGKARFESKEITFTGAFRFKIALDEIQSFSVRRGWLELETSRGSAALQLGSRLAQRWYLKLRYPKTLIDKLGVKDDWQVSVLRLQDSDSREFWKFLSARTDRIARESPEEGSNCIFLRVESLEELKELGELEPFLERDGSIWVLWPKGQPHIKQSHVMAAAKQAGLVDVKIVSFSDRLSALKLVIPVARR